MTKTNTIPAALLAVAICCATFLFVAHLDTPQAASAFEGKGFASMEQQLFEGSELVPPVVDLPSNEVQFCDSCGMAYAIGEPSPFRMTQFDDGTCGLACDYCMAFFALDQSDRDVLRAYWSGELN